MDNGHLSTVWFPAYEKSESGSWLSDAVFDDFDQQAEQLAGHQQHYLQLSPGPFRGRFRSADLTGSVAIHLETCNQALEQDIRGSGDHYTFGLTLGGLGGFIANGRPMGPGDVLLFAPHAPAHIISPAHGAMLAVAIRKPVFEQHLRMFPALRDWVAGLNGGSRLRHSPAFARRMREDVLTVLRLVGRQGPGAEAARGDLALALVSSLLARLALDCASLQRDGSAEGSQGFERFWQCRTWLKADGSAAADENDLTRIGKASRRSIEMAFARTVAMGPQSYRRLLRLHDIRRSLTDPALSYRSIGDIAAEHGFWDWSLFTRHYRRHFGELPSQTRKSLLSGQT